MLKLKLQYFGHLMQRTDSLEKTLMLGKIEGRRRRGRQRIRWLDGITDSMDVSLMLFFAVQKPTLCYPMDYILSGSSVHGISQAIILEWIATPFSRGFPQPRG